MPIYKDYGSTLYAGEMNQRVTFLQENVTVVSGNTSRDWGDAFTCWCAVEQNSGAKHLEADAVDNRETLTFIIRYRADVTKKMRARWNNETHMIHGVVDVGNRHEQLQVIAGSVVTGGN